MEVVCFNEESGKSMKESAMGGIETRESEWESTHATYPKVLAIMQSTFCERREINSTSLFTPKYEAVHCIVVGFHRLYS
jgi:hypothetical protein